MKKEDLKFGNKEEYQKILNNYLLLFATEFGGRSSGKTIKRNLVYAMQELIDSLPVKRTKEEIIKDIEEETNSECIIHDGNLKGNNIFYTFNKQTYSEVSIAIMHYTYNTKKKKQVILYTNTAGHSRRKLELLIQLMEVLENETN